jgi:hypothetical protein
MALQRTTEGRSGAHSYSREAAEPFAIRTLRETFLAYSAKEQERIRESVKRQLRDEQRSHEFAARTDKGKRQGSALAQLALKVYGVSLEDS